MHVSNTCPFLTACNQTFRNCYGNAVSKVTHVVEHHPGSKVHGANMGPVWGRQDPGGPHVSPMSLVIWAVKLDYWISLTVSDTRRFQPIPGAIFTDDRFLNMWAHILPLGYVHSVLIIRCIWYCTKLTLYTIQQHQVIQIKCFKVGCYSILCSLNKAVQGMIYSKWS